MHACMHAHLHERSQPGATLLHEGGPLVVVEGEAVHQGRRVLLQLPNRLCRRVRARVDAQRWAAVVLVILNFNGGGGVNGGAWWW